MKAEELKAIQSPLKEQYAEDPSSALVTLLASGRASAGLSCEVETVKGLVKAGPHQAMGGDGTLACSGNMLLEALVACSGVTLRAVAAAMDIELRDAVITAEGDLDFRGVLAVTNDAPVGFKNLRLRLELDTDATKEQRAMLIKLTERYCVVLQTLRPAIAVEQRAIATRALGAAESVAARFAEVSLRCSFARRRSESIAANSSGNRSRIRGGPGGSVGRVPAIGAGNVV